MPSGRVAALISMIGLTLLLSPVVRATTVEPVTLPELVRRSATIVHGTVQQTNTQWEEGGARLYTYITVSAIEILKGDNPAARSVTFRQLGGRDGDRMVYVPGSPRFAAKQEVLLFLTGDDAGGFPQVMGIFQGAFRPVAGPGGTRRVAGLSAETDRGILPEPAAGGAGAPPASPVGENFGDFLGRIRHLVKEQSAGPRP
jgi:hypothetical protein